MSLAKFIQNFLITFNYLNNLQASQGSDPQGPGQGRGLNPQGQGQGRGLNPQGPGQGRGLEIGP